MFVSAVTTATVASIASSPHHFVMLKPYRNVLPIPRALASSSASARTTQPGAIMKLAPERLMQLIGMDDSQWESASYLGDLLQMLHQQREENINSKRGAYVFAARYMFGWTFQQKNGRYYDSKRKCLWYLGQKSPEEHEALDVEVQRTHYIIQKGQYLSVYMDRKGLSSKRIMRFDMLKPDQRQAFLKVRSLAAAQYPMKRICTPGKHRDLLLLQNSPRHRSRRREERSRVHARVSLHNEDGQNDG